MSTETYYLGTNFGHSAAACLLNSNGELLFAIEEERLVKEKHTERFPQQSINWILQQIPTCKKLVYSEGWNIYKRFLLKGLLHSVEYWNDKNYRRLRFKKEYQRLKEGIKKYRNVGKFRYVGHHISHAYSLLPYGLPQKSLILISDTMGESESISLFYWDKKMRLIRAINYPHSLGSVFHQFAYHLGFKGRTGPGKLMALAGLGKPIWLEKFKQIAKVRQGNFLIDLNIYPAHRLKDGPNIFVQNLPDGEFKRAIVSCENNYKKGLDIAASIQAWFTEQTLELIIQNLNYLRKGLNLEVDHLGLAGGAALNCHTNGVILKSLDACKIKSLTVSPWSEDAGTAIGAAVYSLLKENHKACINKVSPFLGSEAFNDIGVDLQSSRSINEAIKCVLSGKLIALVSGRMEFGPRALGGRCILASPFLADSKSKLNLCKGRPEFMPFAPAILDEDYELLFEGRGSANMAWTVRAKEGAEQIVPSGIHANKEARVQVVTDTKSLLYHLLKNIQKEKKIGILLLTSLNGEGETIPIDYGDAFTVSKRLNLEGIISEKGWEPLS